MFDWPQTPGPRAQRLWEAIVQALYACLSPALSSAVGGGGLGLLQEPTYRLYNCRRCAMQVLICAQCDHGNIYCGQDCSRLSRRESLRRAGARYQHTRCGAARHAARQSAWRARHPKVTHQGSSSGALECTVLTHQLRLSESTDAAVVDPKQTTSGNSLGRCTFCGAELPAWTRLCLWQWGG